MKKQTKETPEAPELDVTVDPKLAGIKETPVSDAASDEVEETGKARGRPQTTKRKMPMLYPDAKQDPVAIKLGLRKRSCNRADLDYFLAQGYVVDEPKAKRTDG